MDGLPSRVRHDFLLSCLSAVVEGVSMGPPGSSVSWSPSHRLDSSAQPSLPSPPRVPSGTGTVWIGWSL